MLKVSVPLRSFHVPIQYCEHLFRSFAPSLKDITSSSRICIIDASFRFDKSVVERLKFAMLRSLAS